MNPFKPYQKCRSCEKSAAFSPVVTKRMQAYSRSKNNRMINSQNKDKLTDREQADIAGRGLGEAGGGIGK